MWTHNLYVATVLRFYKPKREIKYIVLLKLFYFNILPLQIASHIFGSGTFVMTDIFVK